MNRRPLITRDCLETLAASTVSILVIVLGIVWGCRSDRARAQVPFAEPLAAEASLATPTLAPGAVLDQELGRLELRFTEQERTIALLRGELAAVRAEQKLMAERPHPSYTDPVLDWGVVVNDWSVDNGPIINKAIRDGKIWGPISGPAGFIHHTTPIHFGGAGGGNWIGSGTCRPYNEAAFRVGELGGVAVTRFVYTGPLDQHAYRYCGLGLQLDGIVFQRGIYNEKDRTPKGLGFEIYKAKGGNPTGKMNWRQVVFHGWDVPIECTAGGDENNCDNTLVDWAWFHDCRTAFRSNNHQAVSWKWNFIHFNGWGTEVVFDYLRGGGLQVGTLDLCEPATVIRTGAHSSSYEIAHLKADNRAKGWRLVEMREPGMLKLRVNGEIGKSSPPAAGAVVLKNFDKNVPAGYHDIEIDLGGRGDNSQFVPYREYRSEAK